MTRDPRLLSGGNPQIPKGYGEGPVAAYLDAVPGTGPGGWKQAVCRRIDAIVSAEVPGVLKAVKWNTPLYGVEPEHWFLSFHCFTNYVKVTFFKGGSLDPPPNETSKYPAIRHHHVHEGDELGAQFADWVRQASKLPGEKI
jgi:hypothetical protein